MHYKHKKNFRPRFYGPYEGGAKSFNAYSAENRGLKTLSKIDSEFAKIVSEIAEKKVSIKEIKNEIKTGNYPADEWHHTGIYGTKTDYFNPIIMGEYFRRKNPEE